MFNLNYFTLYVFVVGGHELLCVIGGGGGGVEVGTQLVLIVGIKHDDSRFIAYLELTLTKSDKDGVCCLHLCLPVI